MILCDEKETITPREIKHLQELTRSGTGRAPGGGGSHD